MPIRFRGLPQKYGAWHNNQNGVTYDQLSVLIIGAGVTSGNEMGSSSGYNHSVINSCIEVYNYFISNGARVHDIRISMAADAGLQKLKAIQAFLGCATNNKLLFIACHGCRDGTLLLGGGYGFDWYCLESAIVRIKWSGTLTLCINACFSGVWAQICCARAEATEHPLNQISHLMINIRASCLPWQWTYGAYFTELWLKQLNKQKQVPGQPSFGSMLLQRRSSQSEALPLVGVGQQPVALSCLFGRHRDQAWKGLVGITEEQVSHRGEWALQMQMAESWEQDITDVDFGSYSRGQVYRSPSFCLAGVHDLCLHFYPKGAPASGKGSCALLLSALAGMTVKYSLLVGDVWVGPLERTFVGESWGFPEFGDAMAAYHRIGIRLYRVWYQVDLNLDFTSYVKGQVYQSPTFSLSGINGLRLDFYPKGDKQSKDGQCALYLYAPAGTSLTFWLLVGEVWQAPLEKTFENETWGYPNFFADALPSLVFSRIGVSIVTGLAPNRERNAETSGHGPEHQDNGSRKGLSNQTHKGKGKGKGRSNQTPKGKGQSKRKSPIKIGRKDKRKSSPGTK